MPTQPCRYTFHHTDTRNLSYDYYLELLYWNNVWNEQTPALKKRFDPEQRYETPQFIIDLVEHIRKEVPHPRVLDFGCGPFSNLSYLLKTGMADVIGADALGDEYNIMYKKWNVEPPIPVVKAGGEVLCSKDFGGLFDFAYVQNALDHTISPALSWLNMFKLVKPNGYIGHLHSIKESDYQKHASLHQYNLYPDGEGRMMLDDLNRHIFCLSDGLPLKLYYSKEVPIEGGHGYFLQIWQKTGDSPISPEFTENVLENLRRAFVRRSRWASLMEAQINHLLDLEATHKMPYFILPNKP